MEQPFNIGTVCRPCKGQFEAEYEGAAGQGFCQGRVPCRDAAGGSGGILDCGGKFLFREDGIDADAGRVLCLDPGQQIRYQSTGPGPPAEAGQGFIIQGNYNGAVVPTWQRLVEYQAVEEPAVKVRNKGGTQIG